MPDVSPPRHAAQITLPDGRALSYFDEGPREGKPIVFCHGFAMSSLCAPSALHTGAAAPVRIIAIDRPGVGQSTPCHSRTLRSWAGDVGVLADALGLSRFAVVGWSAGGPHALACAAFMAGRISAVSVIASAPPFDDRLVSSKLPREARWLAAAARRAPYLLNLSMAAHVRAVRKNPQKVIAAALKSLCAGDQRVVTDPVLGPSLEASLIAASQSGADGLIEDVKCLIAPWGFDPSAITAKVCLTHGSNDTVIPVGISQAMSAKFAKSILTIIPDSGHFVFASHWTTLIREVLGEWTE